MNPRAVGDARVLRIPVEALLPGQGRRVPSPWGELAVFLLEDGSARALLNSCPHRGGSLAEGIVCGSFVHCTQHDWRLCLDDGRAVSPDEGRTRAFRALRDGLEVVVDGGD